MGNQITLQVWPGNAVLWNKVVVALAFFQHLETMNSAPQFEYARRRTAGIPQICFLLLRVNDLTLAINKYKKLLCSCQLTVIAGPGPPPAGCF